MKHQSNKNPVFLIIFENKNIIYFNLVEKSKYHDKKKIFLN